MLTLSNVAFGVSICMVVMALVWLFGFYLRPMSKIQMRILQVVLYLGLGTCTYMSKIWFGKFAYLGGLLFALGMTATTLLTGYDFGVKNMYVFGLVNTLIHCVAAIYIKSRMLGLTSVLFFAPTIRLGFQDILGKLYVRNRGKNMIPSYTFSGIILTVLGVCFRMFPNCIMDVFVPAMLWMGPFLIHATFLMMATPSYAKGIKRIVTNVLALVFGIGLVLLGKLLNVPELSGYGGTYFMLFLLAKILEIIPKNKIAYAWTFLVVGVFTGVLNMFLMTKLDELGLGQYFHFLPMV